MLTIIERSFRGGDGADGGGGNWVLMGRLGSDEFL
jgi:hypothetical protein